MKKMMLFLGLLAPLALQKVSYCMECLVEEKGDSYDLKELNRKLQYIFIENFSNKSEIQAEKLIKLGADVSVKVGDDRIYLLHYIACNNTCLNLIPLLIEKGVGVDLRNASESTPLMIAARNGHEHIVKILLALGADVNATACFGDTALISAARRGYASIVELLLEHKADPNQKNIYGETALFYAAENGFEKIVEHLLKYKADCTIESVFGETPFSIAGERNNIKALFIKNEKIG